METDQQGLAVTRRIPQQPWIRHPALYLRKKAVLIGPMRVGHRGQRVNDSDPLWTWRSSLVATDRRELTLSLGHRRPMRVAGDGGASHGRLCYAIENGGWSGSMHAAETGASADIAAAQADGSGALLDGRLRPDQAVTRGRLFLIDAARIRRGLAGHPGTNLNRTQFIESVRPFRLIGSHRSA